MSVKGIFINRVFKITGKFIFLMMIVLFFGAWLDPYRDEVSKGNRNYHEKRYNAARTYYKRAKQYAPGAEDKKRLSFNKGDADYKLDSYNSAIASYEMAIKSEDKEVQKKAFFNLGNTYVKMGKFKEAVGAYINALRIDPNYKAPKMNLEYLLKKDKNKDKSKGKDGKDQKGKDKDKNKKNNKNKRGNNSNQRQPRLNKDQVKNLLDAMKKSKVRRQKGGGNNDQSLQRPW